MKDQLKEVPISTVDMKDLLYHHGNDEQFLSDIKGKISSSEKRKVLFTNLYKALGGNEPRPTRGNTIQEKSLWERTIDWVSENPGKTLLGTLLLSASAAYVYNKYKAEPSTVKRRRRKSKLAGFFKEDDPKSIGGEEKPNHSIPVRIISAVSGVIAGTYLENIALAASIPTLAYGAIQNHSLALFAGAGMLAGSLLNKFTSWDSKVTSLTDVERTIKAMKVHEMKTPSRVSNMKGRGEFIPSTEEEFNKYFIRPANAYLASIEKQMPFKIEEDFDVVAANF